MRYTNLDKADLNLLLSFQALVEERSVSRAARRVFLSQPAMSHAFDRLQEMFQDELLVRTPSGYEPTKRALAIYAQLNQMLPRIDQLLRGAEFKPAESTDSFRIAATSHASVWLLPELIGALRQRSPKTPIEITTWEDAFRRLETNAIDLLLSSVEGPPHLRTQLLFREQFVCLVGRNHPIGDRRFTLRRYLNGQHVGVSAIEGRQRLIEQVLEKLGQRRDVHVKIPYTRSVGAIVERTDLIATLPLQDARQLAKLSKTRIVQAPAEFGLFTYNQVWHPRNDNDAAHRWLRQQIQDISSKAV